MKNKISNFWCAITVIAVALAVIFALFLSKVENEPEITEALKQNKDDIINVLLLGRDDAAGLCDVIILGSINTDNGNISFMQIPRDTYFNCGASTYKRLNGAYNSLGSASAVARALGDALGINIDYHLSLGLEALKNMVDAVGGVEINVPTDMNYSDNSQGLHINLKAGRQVLNGSQAVQFVRYRSGYITGDLGRMDAQKLFLNAFAKKIIEMANPMTLYNVFKLVCDNGETNVTFNDFLSVGLKCIQAKNGSVSYMTAPGEAIRDEDSGAWYYILSSPSMTELLNGRFDGNACFDGEGRFVDKSNELFCDIYNKYCDIKIYSADDVENNKININ